MSKKLLNTREHNFESRSKLVFLFFACYGVGIAWTTIPSVGNMLMQGPYKLSDSDYSLLSFALILGALLFSCLSGILGYFKGTKNVITLSCFGLALSFGILFFSTKFKPSNTYIFLFIAQFLTGISIASFLSAISAYFKLKVSKNNVAMFITGAIIAITLGSMSAPQIYAKLGKNWPNATIVMCIYFVLISILIIFFLPVANNTGKQLLNAQGIKSIIFKLDKRFFIFFIIITLYGICEISLNYWPVIYLRQTLNVAFDVADRALTSYWLASAAGQVVILILLKKFSPKIFFVVLPLFLITSFLGLGLSTHEYSAFLFLLCGGVGVSAFFALTMSLAEREQSGIPEIVSSFIVGGYFLGSIIGTLAQGLLMRKDNLSLKHLFFYIAGIAIFVEAAALLQVIKASDKKV